MQPTDARNLLRLKLVHLQVEAQNVRHVACATPHSSSPIIRRLSVATGDALTSGQANMTLEGLLQCTCRVDHAHEMRMPGLIAFDAMCSRGTSPGIQRRKK